MSSLKTHLDSLNFSTQLNLIKDLIDSANVITTFWGDRIIEVKGFTDSISLDDVAMKIFNASREGSNTGNLNPEERISGIEIVKKLQRFYHKTDIEIQNGNPITKFLNWVREFSIIQGKYPVRGYILETPNTLEPGKESLREETAGRNFRTYSRAKFLQQFGTSNYISHPGVEGGDCFPHPQKLYIKEDNIRALLVRV